MCGGGAGECGGGSWVVVDPVDVSVGLTDFDLYMIPPYDT
jgi:hypothetical protein